MDDILVLQAESLLQEKSLMAALCNFTALLNQILDDINWVGFYLFSDDELVLGPFQGKVACTHIAMGKGVCGTSAIKREVIRVADVHQFAGHIACDSASLSEIVLPIIVDDKLWGVLDIDAPIVNRFSQNDEVILKKVVALLEKRISNG